ncbi:hypothetical protein [Daejeonella sp.]|jgi:hypothetical protein|uniref:hypothetical protein n=1 Tax=Daejeonella sp. TaxID=2805397 RepID=UPI0037BF30B5
MDFEFSSSLTRGGNIFTPEKIIISDLSITWKKRNKYLIGFDSISITRDKISSVEVQNKIWGADIIITSNGLSKIIAKNFTVADSKKIREILINK